MSSDRDPARLASLGSGTSAPLAAAIRAMRDERGSVEQARALEARLTAALGRDALQLPAAPRIGRKILAFTALSVLCALLVGWTAARAALGIAAPSRETIAALPAATAMLERPHRQATPAPASPHDATDEQVAVPDAPAAPKPAVRHNRPPVRVAKLPKPTPADPQRELDLLQRCQSALRGNATYALQLADQHTRDFPHGVFVQEREVLAVEALLLLHQRPDAHKRAAQFLQRYAGSPYALRARAVTEQDPPAGERVAP